MLRTISIAMIILLAGCKDPRPAKTEELPQAISSADIIGTWEVLYVSGTTHPMVGGTIELTADHKMITHLKSGNQDDGPTVIWHLLRMETGETIFAPDSSWDPDRDFSPVLDTIEMPVVIVLEGDEMVWNLLTRNTLVAATPSDIPAYRFRKKK